MKKIIRLTENDLRRIVKRVLVEEKSDISFDDAFDDVKKHPQAPEKLYAYLKNNQPTNEQLSELFKETDFKNEGWGNRKEAINQAVFSKVKNIDTINFINEKLGIDLESDIISWAFDGMNLDYGLDHKILGDLNLITGINALSLDYYGNDRFPTMCWVIKNRLNGSRIGRFIKKVEERLQKDGKGLSCTDNTL